MKKRIVAFAVVIGAVLLVAAQCPVLDPLPDPDPHPLPAAVLFFDDFEGGADPAWRPESVAQGQWVVEDGAYTIENAPEDAPMTSFAGDLAWQNYSVEVDIIFHAGAYNPWHYQNQVAVFIRVQDQNNLVAFFVNSGGKSFLKIKSNGVWENLAEGDTPEIWAADVLFTAHGGTYTAYVNGVLVASAEDTRISQGYTGVQCAWDTDWQWDASVSFDNFSVRGLQ